MSGGGATGSCYCERIRFRAEFPSRFVCHCHCHTCRRAHGAAFVTWAGFPAAQFQLTDGESELARYETETGATRSFCRVCGSTLFFESPRWKGEVHVAVAHFRDSLDREPTGHAYADRAPTWCPITDDLPRYGGPSGSEPL